jgi:hypothetical protein
MKGKKIDPEFVSNFISECIKNKLFYNDEILQKAKNKINIINEKIIEAEKLKLIRSKLLDVISLFEEKDYSQRNNELKILPLFEIQNNICKFICDNIKNSAVDIKDLMLKNFNIQDFNFTIKKLVEYKVISKIGSSIVKGELFEEYVKFIFKNS